MRKLIGSAALLALLLVALPLSADTITFIGPTAPTSSDGSVYTGFYTISANPSIPGVNYAHSICLWAGTTVSGSPWTADLMSLLTYEQHLGFNTNVAGEIAYLYEAVQDETFNLTNDTPYIADHGGIPAIADAIWTIQGSPRNASSSNVQWWMGEAASNPSSYSNYSVYAPVNRQGVIDLSISQPFMVQYHDSAPPSTVPEPSTIATLATGVALIFGSKASRRILKR